MSERIEIGLKPRFKTNYIQKTQKESKKLIVIVTIGCYPDIVYIAYHKQY